MYVSNYVIIMGPLHFGITLHLKEAKEIYVVRCLPRREKRGGGSDGCKQDDMLNCTRHTRGDTCIVRINSLTLNGAG